MNATTTPTDPKLIKHDPHCIERSPYQPRRKFDPAEMFKLTESVKEIGLIQPLVARPHPTKEGWLEQLVGERRLRACKAAELPSVPVLLRTGLTDQQAEQIVLEENLQREDLTTSEEGHAFQRLLQMTDVNGRPVHTQKSVAEFVHKDVDYVVSRLKLLVCPEELVTAVDDGTVAVSVALLVGRIPDPKARALCAKQVLHPELQQVPLNYVQTKEHIREYFMVALNKKNFDLDDAHLVPVKLDASGERCQGGSCMDCPFRSGNLEGIELQNGSSRNSGVNVRGSSMGADTMLCTLPRCHRLKLDAVWKDKKLAAERAGKKTLDGPAAERAFGGHNGDLAHDSGLTDLKHAQRVAADHGVKLEDIEVQRVVARHPDTLAVHELVDWKKTHSAILAAEEAAQKERKAQPKTDRELQQEADEKQRKAEESRRDRLDKLCLHESLTEIVNRITAKGMDLEFLDLAFQLALGMSGADGMYAVGKWLEIKLPKGTANSGRDYEEEILKILRERCGTANAWLAHIVIALIARGVKWNGVRCEDFELVLNRCGFKLKEIERRAKALLEGEEKAKRTKEKPAPKSGAKEDWSVEKEASKTAAADEIAKGKVGHPVRCFAAADAVGMVDAMLTAHVEPSVPNENGVFQASQDFKMTVRKQVSFTIRVAAKKMSADDDFDVGYCTGYGFECGQDLRGSGGPSDGHVFGVLSAALLHEAEDVRRSLKGMSSKAAADAREALNEVIRLLKVQAAKDTAAWHAKHNPQPADSDGPIMKAAKQGIVMGKPGPGMFGRGVRGKSANAKDYAAAGKAKAGDSGPSISETITGIQDTKIGKPERWNADDVEAGAKLLKAKTHQVADLIGPAPNRKEKIKLKNWNAVRLRLLRKAGKAK